MKAPQDEKGSRARSDITAPSSGAALNLSPPQGEALLRLVEQAHQVWRRHQFFLWSQGPLHALLPHELLVCGAYSRHKRSLSFSVFQSVVLSPLTLNLFTGGDSALLRVLCASWVQSQGQAALFDGTQLVGEAQTQWQQLMRELGATQLLVHGVARPQRPSEIESLFIFGGAKPAGSASQRLRLADLLVPYLHSTWRRVQAAELAFNGGAVAAEGGPASSSAQAQDRPGVLTQRECEILCWAREGKSNLQIGQGLGISALTVKNHIQKILRKLGASNRAHAVALAMSQNLFAPFDGMQR